MNSKVCKQCGNLKELSMFRGYYGNRKGTYTTCKDCEKINARAKYLSRKSRNDAEEEELQKIYDLWDAQRSVGLHSPNRNAGNKKSVSENLDSMIEAYTQKAQQLKKQVDIQDLAEAPLELVKWLTEPLVEEPDYYQDTVYESLRERYRPQIGIDAATLLPIYNESNAKLLEAVINRFYEYEESYYE